MSNQAKDGGTHRHGSNIKSRNSIVTTGVNSGNMLGPTRQALPSKRNRAMSDQEKTDFTVFMSILVDPRSRYYYQPFGDDNDVEIEIDFIDDIQRLQFKVAAGWCVMRQITERTRESNSITSVMVIRMLRSQHDDSAIGFKVIYKPNGPLPAGVKADAILKHLDVPSAPELMQLSKSEIYNLIEDVFDIEGVDRSEYETIFSATDMPSICSDLCASVYEAFGEITFPPMSLIEFGNVLHSLKFFDTDVALATLQRIYRNRR